MISPRHDLVADAALRVLAQAGARGLTHRAVDAAAELPSGSTSYYFRSRAALLAGCVQRLLESTEQEIDALGPLVSAADPKQLATALSGLLQQWLTTGRARQLARYELTLEAARQPNLAAELHRAGQLLRERMAHSLATCGANDPDRQARLLIACVDGILFDRIVGAGSSQSLQPAELDLAARDLLSSILPGS